jgi:hypothetical protein
MKKLVTFFYFILHFAVVNSVQAQYATALGGRIGKFSSGIDFKHLSGRSHDYGFELFAGYTNEAHGGYMSRAFFVKQFGLRNSMLHIPLYMIVGVGGHAGYYPHRFYSVKEGIFKYYNDNTVSAGVDTDLGLEWNSREYPFTVGIDVNPYYSLLNPGPEILDVSFVVRFRLDR